MKIEVDIKFILITILLCLFYNVRIYFLFLVFILLHELAHLIVGILFGLKIKMVNMNPFGVKIEFYSLKNKKITSKQKVILNFAGPMFNFILVALFLMFPVEEGLKLDIIYTNIALGIFNLLPIMPLDGGKILKEYMIIKVGIKNSNIYSIKCSKFFLVIFSLAYSILIFKIKNVFIFFIIIYLWYLHLLEERKLQNFLRVYNIIEKTKAINIYKESY